MLIDTSVLVPAFSTSLPPFTLSNLALILTLLVLACLFCPRLPRLSTLSLRALQYGGPIPFHVAFIMDGNRRWARQGGRPAHEGHPEGGEKLIESLQWCLDAGVRIVTVYAFSIENFKRSALEVDQLMSLALRKFHQFAVRSHVIHANRVRVRILGDLSLIPPDVRTAMASVMRDTAKYVDGPTLNICFAYTARHDIASSVRRLATLCHEDRICPNQITESSVAACLSTGYTRGADLVKPVHQYPQLLVRTSGETRLSDFLLWEVSNAILSFNPVLWPALSAWDFVHILLDYQLRCTARLKAKVRRGDQIVGVGSDSCDAEDGAIESIHGVLEGERRKYVDDINTYCCMKARTPRAFENPAIKIGT